MHILKAALTGYTEKRRMHVDLLSPGIFFFANILVTCELISFIVFVWRFQQAIDRKQKVFLYCKIALVR